MPDERIGEIEKRINRDVTEQMQLAPAGGTFALAPRSMTDVLEFAKLMAVSGVAVRPFFRGNPGACLAIAIQAMKWGADPFAVANKAYVVKNRAGDEQIAYEAQLIHAIVNASPILARRLRPHYEGEGQNRSCRIVGFVRGEDEPLEYESPPIGKIAVKNSPLWQADPDQQLFYYSTRAWARRHVPEILLGIYAPDEFAGETIDLTPEPEPKREDFVEPEPEPADERPVYVVVDLDGVEHEFRDAAVAETALFRVLQEAAKIGADRLAGVWESQDFREPWPADMEQRAAAEMKRLGAAIQKPAQPPQERVNPAPLPEPTQTEQPPPEPPDAPAAAPEPQTENADRDSREITPPLRQGKPDYRTWLIALFLPKMRQITNSNDMAFLLGDNDVHLEAARRSLARDDLGALENAIAARWKELD